MDMDMNLTRTWHTTEPGTGNEPDSGPGTDMVLNLEMELKSNQELDLGME